ncbi:MAG: phosphodiester glycosidase family protein [PVC group bacterium]
MLTAITYHRMRNEALAPSARCLVTVNGNVSGYISAGMVRSFADPAHLLIHDWSQFCFGIEENSGERRAFVREMYLKKEEVGAKAPSGVRCALLSWPYYAWPLIEKGKNAYLEESLDFQIIAERHPRTIVGTDGEGRFVYLVIIKGRDPIHAFGMSFAEAADFLREHFPDISDAINLDGGFSSVLVLDRPGGLREVFPDNHEDRALPNVVQVIESCPDE